MCQFQTNRYFLLAWTTIISTFKADAFPPNFVHSLDSTHMMLTTLYCRQRGVTFAAVHDCFWTHAADVEIMNEICRDQFIRLHSQPIVENLGEVVDLLWNEVNLSVIPAIQRNLFDQRRNERNGPRVDAQFPEELHTGKQARLTWHWTNSKIRVFFQLNFLVTLLID